MDPRRLLTFRVVAHERSFSGAARKLSLSQPSVSHQVAALETEVGVRLLDRGRGGLRLTPAGEVLLEHADHVAWRLELAERQISEISKESRALLRLGAFPTALTGFVPAAIARLRESRGDVRVLLSEVTTGELERRFLRGELDLAIGFQDSSEERRELKGTERIELLQETFLVGMSADHPLARESGPVDLAQLAEDE